LDNFPLDSLKWFRWKDLLSCPSTRVPSQISIRAYDF
jgi:hypothetical protein